MNGRNIDLLEGLDTPLRDRAEVTVYVIGLAPDAVTPGSQWRLSAQRAKAVQEHLAGAFREPGSGRGWKFLSWGAGAGGAWRRRMGPTAGQPHG